MRSRSLVSTQARNSRSDSGGMPVEGDDGVVILVTLDGAERRQRVKIPKLVRHRMASLRQQRH